MTKFNKMHKERLKSVIETAIRRNFNSDKKENFNIFTEADLQAIVYLTIRKYLKKEDLWQDYLILAEPAIYRGKKQCKPDIVIARRRKYHKDRISASLAIELKELNRILQRRRPRFIGSWFMSKIKKDLKKLKSLKKRKRVKDFFILYVHRDTGVSDEEVKAKLKEKTKFKSYVSRIMLINTFKKGTNKDDEKGLESYRNIYAHIFSKKHNEK